MKRQDAAEFKNELKNYKYYQTNLKGTLKLIEYNEYLLSNVRGVDPAREPVTGSKTWVETDEYKRICDELERLNKHKQMREAQIEHIESVLAELSEQTREACIDIYVNRISYEKAIRKYGYSKSGLWYRIQAELEKKP